MLWLDTLGGVIQGFIAQMAIDSVAIRRKSMDKKAMQIIFCLVFTFNHIANELFPNLKDIMRIKKETLSNFLMLLHVNPHNYDQDNNEKDTKIPPLSPFSSTVCSLAFIQLAHHTNNVSRRVFITLLVHQAHANNNRDET